MMTPLPADFVVRLRAQYPLPEAEALLAALDGTAAVTSVRRNPLKAVPCVADGGVPVPWCSAGRVLAERPSFTRDPLFHAGAYYVQEAASMFVAAAYAAIVADAGAAPTRLLDLCAAPGGKSTLWRALLPDGALLVANEPVRVRAQILAENLTKWGHPDVVTTSGYGADFAALRDFFDVIATDVPCSGEGMFRKDETARSEWSAAAVQACADRQWDIVSSVWPALRPGGYLVYSTCTFNREENEDMAARIARDLGADVLPIAIDPAWGVLTDPAGSGLPVYHFLPSRTVGEGFCLTLLRKHGSAPAASPRRQKGRGRDAKATGASLVAPWLTESGRYRLFAPAESHVAAVSETLYDAVQRVRDVVPTLTSGVLLAELKGKKAVPQHALAMSVACRADTFARVPVDEATALGYLHREAVVLPPSAPRGYVVLTYGGLPLGFVNNLGARANNMYPPEWRIRF